MKILLADHHHEVRAALRLVLEQQPGIHLIGEARDAIELFALMTNECPDIVLLDPDMPGVQIPRRVTRTSLAELVDTLHRWCPALRVVSLSSQPDAEKDSKLAKADAFFCKSDPPDELLALLQRLIPAKPAEV